MPEVLEQPRTQTFPRSQTESYMSVFYEQITDSRVFSPRLGLELVQTENTFRLFNPQTNEFLRTLEESEAERHQIASELDRLKAEIERLKAEK